MFHLYCSLLEKDEPKVEISTRLPYFFTDLNIDQLLPQLKLRAREYNIQSYFMLYPKNIETVWYRQQIFTELKDKELKSVFIRLSDAMKASKSFTARMQKTTYDQQRRMLFFNSVEAYVKGVSGFVAEMTAKNPESEGLKRILNHFKGISEVELFQNAAKEIELINGYLSEVNFNLTLTNNTLRLAAGRSVPYYAKKMKRLFPEQFLHHSHEELPWIDPDDKSSEAVERRAEAELAAAKLTDTPEEITEFQFRSPFAARDTLSNLEAEIVEVYKKFSPELFRHLSSFSRRFRYVMEDSCFRLDQEAWFYLSYLELIQELERNGFPFCTPEVVPEGRLMIENGFDIALAWKNMKLSKEVIKNSLSYEQGERFFVLTGPNQGGKTTFARSLGQLVYLSMMGLSVPGERAKLPFFEGLLTHFSVEESLESGRGKLKEELIRLAPMMKDKGRKQFVILNELFTTAATHDAYIMGERVVRHFMELGCVGIYVTHIPELAGGSDGVVSLVALADAADHRIRTFRIARKPAERTGYAGDIVERHRLSYQSLSERVKSRLGGSK